MAPYRVTIQAAEGSGSSQRLW